MQKNVYATIFTIFITLLVSGQAPVAIIKGTLMATDAGFSGNEFVIAQNIETGNEVRTKKTDIEFKEDHKASYTLKVPPGKYYIFSKTPNSWDIPAYYTEFVTCGLKSECPSHKKIIVIAVSGKTISQIDPQDNYYTNAKQLDGNTYVPQNVIFGQPAIITKPVVTKDSLIGFWEGRMIDKTNQLEKWDEEYYGRSPHLKLNIISIQGNIATVQLYENAYLDSTTYISNFNNDFSVRYRDSVTTKLNLLNESTILLPYFQIDGKDTCQGNVNLIIRYDERFKGLYLTGLLKGQGANCSNYRFSFRKINRIYFNYYDSLNKASLTNPPKKSQETGKGKGNPSVNFNNKGNNNSNLSSEDLKKKEEEENRKNIERREQGNKEEKMAPIGKNVFSGSTTPSDLGRKLITAIKTNNKALWYNCILRDTKEKCDADLEQVRKCLMSKGVDNWNLLTFSRVTYIDDTKKGGDLSFFKIEFNYGKDFVGAVGGGNYALQYKNQYMIHHSFSSCLMIRE